MCIVEYYYCVSFYVRCTRYHECPLQDVSSRWLSYNDPQCIEITDIAPDDSHPITVTEQQVTFETFRSNIMKQTLKVQNSLNPFLAYQKPVLILAISDRVYDKDGTGSTTKLPKVTISCCQSLRLFFFYCR